MWPLGRCGSREPARDWVITRATGLGLAERPAPSTENGERSMAIDEATREFMRHYTAAEQARGGEGADLTIEERRQAFSTLAEAYGRGPEMHEVRETTIELADRDIPVRLLVPVSEPVGVMVYFHGGGWVLGGLDDFDALGRKLAARTGYTVALVDYRLAPEHTFPAAHDDALAAARWVPTSGIPGADGPLVLGGDSAGGNLALSTALGLRGFGPSVHAMLLVYPTTDTDPTRASYADPDNQLMLTSEAAQWFLSQYLPAGDPADPRLAPLREPRLDGAPPAIIAIAELDPLRDEGEAFAERLRREGRPVRERLFRGQMHGFFQLTNVLPASDTAVEWLADELAALPIVPSGEAA